MTPSAKLGPADPQGRCIRWTGSADKRGYGLTVGEERKVDARAHRAAYKIAKGPIPEGYDVHHKCRNTWCVNPDHLEAMTIREHDLEHYLHEKGLTVETIKEIRELGRQPGVRAPDVAKRFGISEFSVYRHWRGDSWADMLGEPELIKPTQDCPVCGESFTAKHRTRVYCSDRCKQRNYWRKRNAA